MTSWPSIQAKRLPSALLRAGWAVKRVSGFHRTLSKPGMDDFVFAFHDKDEIGPAMVARTAKHTGITPGDL
jgi:predicted RNA binding protein YcfA (HicA-like mRNA interferase family)